MLSKLKKKLRRRTRGHRLISLVFAFYTCRFSSQKEKDALEQVFRNHCTPQQLSDEKWVRKAKWDIAFCKYYYWIDADEYFRYQFENLSNTGRKRYVGVYELIAKLSKLGNKTSRRVLQDKNNTYRYYKEYFKREQLKIDSESERKAFLDFCSRHPSFFVKPSNKACGMGVHIVHPGADGSPEALFSQILKNGPTVVEEPIRQAPELAKFHPQSINTIRVVTLRGEEGPEIIQTSIRMGTGESIVDNGCLSSAVDPQTGIIISPGRSAHTKGLFIIHPDTQEKIIGASIPAWDELLALCRRLAAMLPDQPVIGWDMAYTVDGWAIVEANSIPAIQILSANGSGARELFEKILRA